MYFINAIDVLNETNAYNHTSDRIKNIVDILSRNTTNLTTDNSNEIIKT